jgi:hypothetical protein
MRTLAIGHMIRSNDGYWDLSEIAWLRQSADERRNAYSALIVGAACLPRDAFNAVSGPKREPCADRVGNAVHARKGKKHSEETFIAAR